MNNTPTLEPTEYLARCSCDALEMVHLEYFEPRGDIPWEIGITMAYYPGHYSLWQRLKLAITILTGKAIDRNWIHLSNYDSERLRDWINKAIDTQGTVMR